MGKTLSQKLLEVQQEVVGVTKSSDNPYFKSKYADLNSVLEVVKKPLNSRGVVIANSSGADAYGKYLETSLINVEDNQQIASRKYFSGNEKNLQELGAADTYARRFNLTNLLSLEALDDDGESAVGRGNNSLSSSRKPEPKASDDRGAKGLPKPTEAPKGDKQEAKPGSPVAAKEANKEKDLVLKKISLTSKVIIDSKRDTQENLVALLKSYKVSSKEELTMEQAKNLLGKLEEKLK
jgi:hypothetical protein